MFNEILVVSGSVVGCGDTRVLESTSMCSHSLVACNFPGVAVKIAVKTMVLLGPKQDIRRPLQILEAMPAKQAKCTSSAV